MILRQRSNASSLTFLMLCTIFLLSMLFYRISSNVIDPDIWHEMALIREAFLRGHIPSQDLFAFTPTINPVVHHEWLAGGIAYLLTAYFGASSILLAKYLLALSIAMISVQCARRKGAQWILLVFVLPIGIFLIDSGFSPIRAQLYTYIFVALLLMFLDLDRKGNRRWMLWWIPIFVVWINLHGGFSFSFVLLGAHWLEQILRRQPHLHLIILGALMAGVIVFNPFGSSYYFYLFHALTMPRPHISEWAPLWNDTAHHMLFFSFSIFLLAYSTVKAGLQRCEGVIPVLACALTAIAHNRFINLYAIAWVCYVPAYLQVTPLGESMDKVFHQWRKALILLWSLASIVFIFRFIALQHFELLVPGQPLENRPKASFYPVGPVEYLKQQDFRGNLMTPYNYGAYVSWKLYPAVKVSMDSRYEVAYPTWLYEEIHRFYAGDGWRAVLDAYPTDAVLVPRSSPLVKLMPEAPGWRKVYSDRAFELYMKESENLPVVNRSDQIIMGEFP